MSESDAADLVPLEAKRRRGVRWKAVVGLASFAGLIVATITTVSDARAQARPGALPLVVGLGLQFVAMVCAARGWVALFPGDADRTALSHGLYASQLTKYLPAGGFVQAASQVALSSQTTTVSAAALRLPVFSVCSVVAAATVGSLLAFASELPSWARLLAILGLALLALLDRRVMAAALRLARRVVGRLPGPEYLPEQRGILRCYGYVLVNQVAYATAFVVLVENLADVDQLAAAAAFCAGWAIGYLALPLPSGLLVREAVLIAALPGLATASLLAASVAHRLTGFLAEAALALRSHLRVARRGRTDASPEGTSTDATGQLGSPDPSDRLESPLRRTAAFLQRVRTADRQGCPPAVMSGRTRQLEYSTLQPEMHNESSRRAKAAKILAVLRHFRGEADLNGATVVDVGCSTGFITDEFRRAGAAAIGIDIDMPGLAAARSNFGDGVSFVCADGERLSFPEGSVDIVVFNHIYEHVVDADAVIREIVRILVPGGLVYLGLGNKWGIIEPHYGLPFLSWLPPKLADRYVSSTGRADAYHERFRGERQLRNMTSALTVWDYTTTVLAEPDRFCVDDVVPRSMAHLPLASWKAVRPLVPTFIWVGAKGAATPAGPELKSPPRRLAR